MHVWNVVHAAHWKYRTQKAPFWHHRTTLSGYICGSKACIDNRKKNLLNSNTFFTCPDNMANFFAYRILFLIIYVVVYYCRVSSVYVCYIYIIQFSQHADLQKHLIETGDARIVFACKSDGFLGTGCDSGKLLKAGSYPGKNHLGRSLMRLRQKFQQQVLSYQHEILFVIVICAKIVLWFVKKVQMKV